jgi:hypothetical protein
MGGRRLWKEMEGEWRMNESFCFLLWLFVLFHCFVQEDKGNFLWPLPHGPIGGQDQANNAQRSSAQTGEELELEKVKVKRKNDEDNFLCVFLTGDDIKPHVGC